MYVCVNYLVCVFIAFLDWINIMIVHLIAPSGRY